MTPILTGSACVHGRRRERAKQHRHHDTQTDRGSPHHRPPLDWLSGVNGKRFDTSRRRGYLSYISPHLSIANQLTLLARDAKNERHDHRPRRVRFPRGAAPARGQAEVRRATSSRAWRTRRRAVPDGDHRRLRRLPLLAHAAGPVPRGDAAAAARSHPRAEPHVLRGRVGPGRGRGRQDRHLLDGHRPALGPLAHPARVRGVGPRALRRSGAISGSAFASAPPPWACRSCRRSRCSAPISWRWAARRRSRAPTPARRSTPCPPSIPTWRCSTCSAPTASATARSTAIRTWTPISPSPPRPCW